MELIKEMDYYIFDLISWYIAVIFLDLILLITLTALFESFSTELQFSIFIVWALYTISNGKPRRDHQRNNDHIQNH